jgi:hypothetical protein
MEKANLISFALIAAKVTSDFAVFRCENMVTGKLISALSFVCHDMYMIES